MPRMRSAPVFAALLLALAPARVPADDQAPALNGTWTWSWKDADGTTHRHALEVEGQAGKYVARERFDDQEAVKVNDLTLTGKKVSFTVVRGERQAIYTGNLADKDTINGMVSVSGANNQPQEFGWTASRKAPEKK